MIFQLARRLLAVQVLLLFVGTQMPGVWRAGVVASLDPLGSMSSVAHFVLFTGMAAVALSRSMEWPWVRALVWALGPAPMSEGMQFFAIDRHPRWLDVGIDMVGVLTAITVLLLVTRQHKA